MASVGRTLRRWTVFRSLPLSPSSCGRTVVRMSSTRMVRLDSRRLLRVVGEDKGSVLQGLVTNDLTTSQSVQYAMLLNPQVQRLRACVRAYVRVYMCACTLRVCTRVHRYACVCRVAHNEHIRLFSVLFSSSPSPGEGTVRDPCVQGGSRPS